MLLRVWNWYHFRHTAKCSQAAVYVVQATLQSLLERLAVDHPHHSLYQLFALKNGNRGKDGKAVQAGDVVGGMAVTVDHDKVAAAQELLTVVGANPARSALTHCCHSTSHHSRQGDHEDMSMCLDDIKSRVPVNGYGKCLARPALHMGCMLLH